MDYDHFIQWLVGGGYLARLISTVASGKQFWSIATLAIASL